MKKVILAEDIKAMIEKDGSFFNRSGIITIAAKTNDEILALHKTENADLIISNLDTPGMSGEDLCSAIRSDQSLRAVSIMIVCAETAENLQRCAQCDANAFIASPITQAVLLQEAYQLLNVTTRKSCRIPLKIRIEGSLQGKIFSGFTENISASGMLFESSAKLFEGDAVRFSLALPGPRRVTANAEIVRVINKGAVADTKYSYGVIFVDVTDEDISAIESFIGGSFGTLSSIS